MRDEVKCDITLALVTIEGYVAMSLGGAINSANLARNRVCKFARGDGGCRCTRVNPDMNLPETAGFGRVKGVGYRHFARGG